MKSKTQHSDFAFLNVTLFGVAIAMLLISLSGCGHTQYLVDRQKCPNEAGPHLICDEDGVKKIK